MEYLPNTNDWYGRHRLVARRENDYFIDREMQKNGNYTGIQGIGRQDQAAVECMGEIVDRSLEHLAPSDRMIAITRKRLLEACQKLMNEGTVPPLVDDPTCLPARARRFVHRAGEAGLARRVCRQAAGRAEPARHAAAPAAGSRVVAFSVIPSRAKRSRGTCSSRQTVHEQIPPLRSASLRSGRDDGLF